MTTSWQRNQLKRLRIALATRNNYGYNNYNNCYNHSAKIILHLGSWWPGGSTLSSKAGGLGSTPGNSILEVT